ncbi:uncharacterized protein N7483_012909 [Penicillium malachiteum]|uniref:uncharacterized protein n=1 Tax=Penicillium malachiteum TaxID=1324776 RepID=UPI002548F0C0|nr:uncharacterized protein N7483_012909 [Penicillium malachiteum]KAJ5715728.1 hypothetical protein N7483_012909 [Penicillium malachiteum]
MDILQQSYKYGRSPLPQNAYSIPLKTYLFGKSISHSLSPRLQNIMFHHIPSKWTFHLAEETDPAVFRKTLEDESCIGTSITMPSKLSFQPVLDEITDEARIMGSVNTVFIRLTDNGQRRYIGTNTDCIGIRDAILAQFPDAVKSSRGRAAMVIGSGGAARSAVYALWKWFEPSEIFIVNRDTEETETLIEGFRGTLPEVVIRNLRSVEEAKACMPFLIVGTVPDFEPKEPGEIIARDIIQSVIEQTSDAIVVDMCYSPSVMTSLGVLALRNKLHFITGVSIVVRVNIAQHMLWLEGPPHEKGLKEALLIGKQVEANALGSFLPSGKTRSAL